MKITKFLVMPLIITTTLSAANTPAVLAQPVRSPDCYSRVASGNLYPATDRFINAASNLDGMDPFPRGSLPEIIEYFGASMAYATSFSTYGYESLVQCGL